MAPASFQGRFASRSVFRDNTLFAALAGRTGRSRTSGPAPQRCHSGWLSRPSNLRSAHSVMMVKSVGSELMKPTPCRVWSGATSRLMWFSADRSSRPVLSSQSSSGDSGTSATSTPASASRRKVSG